MSSHPRHCTVPVPRAPDSSAPFWIAQQHVGDTGPDEHWAARINSDAPAAMADDGAAAASNLAAAVAVVEAFVPVDEIQAEHRRRLLEFVADHEDALHRTCESGHLTASAWVVNYEATAGLVLLHAKIGRWLQPGGHADGDSLLARVALREATEETGIEGLEVWSEPVDIDVHLFVNRKRTEPDHLHFDVRYLIRAPLDAAVRGNHESEALRWVSAGELNDPVLDLDASTRRLARHSFNLACELADRSDADGGP